MKILVAGLDDTTIHFLRGNGTAVEIGEIEDVEDLQSWLVDGLYDAGVINLEKTSLGVYAARVLRAGKITTPLLGISSGLSERKWSDHRAIFLENGGDDLLKDPVNPRELIASLRAIVRRFKGSLLDVVELESGHAFLKINLTTRSVTVNGVDPALTERELALLLLLASSPGRVWSKEMIITQMYSGSIDEEPEMKIVDVFVCKLRKKFADTHPDAGRFIETVWGRGYQVPVEVRTTKTSSVA